MRANRKKINKSKVLDDLDEALTNSSKVAATLGDEFLVYVIDMAILHVRKTAIHLDDAPEQPKQDGPHTNVVNFEVTRSRLLSLASGVRSMSAFHSGICQ